MTLRRPAWCVWVVLVVSWAALAAQSSLPPPFPRTNATLLLENDRIRVWDVVWPKGQPTALHRHIYDQVGTYYAPGGRIITTPDGAARTADTPVGALSATRKGTTHIEAGSTEPPLRAVFIELKHDAASGVAAADVGLPAFPRDGAKQVQDDDRVTVWDVAAWSAGPTALRYRAARDTVLVWLGEGTVRVTPANGAATTASVTPGTMRYLSRGASESLDMVSGSPRAMFFQLK